MADERKESKSFGACWKKTSEAIAAKSENNDGTYFFVKVEKDMKAGSYMMFPKKKTSEKMPDFEIIESTKRE